ncbi:hypothetical protein [Actinokineospora sp. NBRC 105648]|uniref:hypothetical protein n=1 Tax=Actinokineospora sp. NBRC 105648 TaxID=3032206 RepID=UPI0024A4E6A7|nr:hypothetical protein [Actinokineospora sp. NBRC 105648]GLZ42687.1 hypothetical protein Acsp05_63110 [Actinokineospora sp. NBRC 105648]
MPGADAVIDRGLWWSVWWPWVAVWALTALAVVVAVGAFALAWSARARAARTRHVPEITFYLHEKSVMDLYRAGGYGDALRREVEVREGASTEGWFGFATRFFRGHRRRTDEREMVSRYITTAEPIEVIGVLIDALDAADGVVHVDLRNQTMVRTGAVAAAQEKEGSATVRLRQLDGYVSVRGVFRMTEHNGGRPVFLAPFGDPDDPGAGPQLRVECHQDGLRDDEIPEGPFHARCLGKVQSWNSGELVVRPIAIFQ